MKNTKDKMEANWDALLQGLSDFKAEELAQAEEVKAEHALIEKLHRIYRIRRRHCSARERAKADELGDLLGKQKADLEAIVRFGNEIEDYWDMLRETMASDKERPYPKNVSRLIDLLRFELNEIFDGAWRLELLIKHREESKDNKLTFIS